MKPVIVVRTILALSLSVSSAVASSEQLELRAAFLPECPTVVTEDSHRLAPIVAAIGVALVGQLVSSGVSYVKSVTDPSASSEQISINLDGWYQFNGHHEADTPSLTVSSRLGCLVIARGQFPEQSSTSNIPAQLFRAGVPADQLARAQKALKSANLAFEGDPAFYLEARRVTSPDKSAVTWKPFVLYLGNFYNNSLFAGSSRGFEIDVMFATAGAAQPFGKLEFQYPAVKKPYVSIAPIDPNTHAVATPYGSWIANPATDKINLMPTPPDDTAILPVNVTVQVTETPKPYKLATAFGSAISAASGTIATTAEQAIIPSVRQAAKQTNESNTVTALSDYVTAFNAKETDCKANGQSVECSVDKDKLTVARNAALSACNVAYLSTCDQLK
jgi:hypothetical protein